jgi:hypothetical protein
MPSEIYRLICIVDSFQNGDQTPSIIDASPDYLHIHILKSAQLQTIEEFSSKLSDKTDNEILFQWGIPLEKDAKTRSEKVSASKVREFGNIGLGSAARGNGEQIGDFIGGGEGFLFDDQNFRITKGDTAFEAKNEQTYWTFQVADFNGAKKIGDFKDLTISGRNNLMQILKERSNGKPFVAVFDAQFEENLFARSNGIFPEDLSRVSDSKQSLFIGDVMGGHLVGGSTNEGDISSLRQTFSELEANKLDFTLTIKSEVILKPISELQIAKSDSSFRKPRTAIEVENAVQVIQKYWREKTDGRK